MAFRDVVGHQRPVAILRRAIAAGRVHHAYLFTGIEGIGKRLVAVAVAKVLNCLEGRDDACEECAVCRRIEGGVHPDVMTIVPDGDRIKVEQIRDLQQVLALKPFEAGQRVVIVDGAERLTEGAANAFLKILEEPPPATVIILVVAGVESLPPTVSSRCHRVSFYPLGTRALREVLARHLSGEDLELAVEVAAGSPGRGMRMDRDTVMLLRRYGAEAYAASLSDRMKVAEALHQHKERGRLLLEQLAIGIRDTVVLREAGVQSMVHGREGSGKIGHTAAGHGTKELLERFWFVTEVLRGLDYHGNLRVSLEVALMGREGVWNDEISWS